MKKVYFIFFAWLISSAVWADGLPLRNGRYHGEVLVFNLTESQKQVIGHYRTCQLEKSRTMNIYTPYVFTLSQNQSRALKAKKGFSPKHFSIFETVRGFNDAGPHWNLVLRFSENQIEIPLNLVVTDKDAKANHKEQGWDLHNPCFPKLHRR